MSIFLADNYFFNIHAIPLFSVGALILLSGLFVFHKMRNDSVALTFLVMSLSGSVWFLCTAMGYLSRVPQVGLFWFKIDNVGVVFLSSTVYSFVVTFLGLFNERKYFVVGGYLISAIFAILTLTTNWMDTGVQTFFWGYFPKWGFLSRIFFPFFFVYMLFSFIELFARLRTEENQKIKNQIIYFLLAFGMAYTSSIDYFATFGVPIYPASFISMGAYFFIIAYAVTKHRLLNITLAISRTAAWIMATSFLLLIYVGCLTFYRTYISTQTDAIFVLLSILYGLSAGLVFQKIRFFIQTGADKAFIKGWYDYRRVQRKISSELRKAVSMEDALKIIRDNLDEEVDVSRVSVLLPDPGSGDYVSEEIRIPADSELIEVLKEKKDIVSKEDFPSLPDNLCIPCFSGDELSALVMLGKKRSEDPYNDQDFDIFKTLSDEISDTLLRIRPYEEVKQEFEKANAKLLEAEKQLERSQRLASLGTLAAGVAHEIRNPLTVIKLKSAKLNIAEMNENLLESYKNSVSENIDRITHIIRGMLNLSNPREKKESVIELEGLIRSTLSLMTISGIELSLDFQPSLKIKGDPEDLKQIFINLIDNANIAMAGGGRLSIRTFLDEGSSEAVVQVSDTGVGIPKEIQDKIFDPFFSTRHEGVGLGLSIVYRIVREHGGSISVESPPPIRAGEVGKGTVFTIKFPQAA